MTLPVLVSYVTAAIAGFNFAVLIVNLMVWRMINRAYRKLQDLRERAN